MHIFYSLIAASLSLSAFISPCIHFAVHSFRRAFISPCIHFAVHSFRRAFISPCIHFAIVLCFFVVFSSFHRFMYASNGTHCGLFFMWLIAMGSVS